ncbi:MAG: DUF2807 domain-containing protein [Emcibacter sp.]|nr:DUF2807 domain-containing protein [Emcibacter sp.]
MNKILTPMIAAMMTGMLIPSSQAADKNITLDVFSMINVKAPLDFDISVGKTPSFHMEGKAEDFDKVIFAVKDGLLTIKKKKKSGHIGRIKVTITMQELTNFTVNGSSDAVIRDVNSPSFGVHINGSGDVTFSGKGKKLDIEINGSGNIKSENFDSENLRTEINGSGNVALQGKCGDMKMSISGSGDFKGEKLTCTNAWINISGSGDAMIFASETLEVDTSGSSNVMVSGHPKSVKNKSTGSSEFIIEGDK